MDTTSQKTNMVPSSSGLVGADLLGLITGGMYVDPLVLYREYIQNAADAIEMLPRPQEGKIEIEIDAVGRNIRVRDNGPGLSHQQAVEALVPLSKSNKDYRHNRGFRGVGRMCGLAFAKSISFRTRTSGDSTVTSVFWDGEVLRSCLRQHFSIEDTVAHCVRVEQKSIQDVPANFFEVELLGMSRQAAVALNRVAVKDYISKVGPIPFNDNFPYRTGVVEYFKEHTSLLEIDIHLFDKSRESITDYISITKPHSGDALMLDGKDEKFVELERIEVPNQLGEGLAAAGWIAHTNYQGALPQSLGIRCLRARVGNIQIGDEFVFDHLFSESRFNRWCVGEIHILDTEIVPNGSRDYFELNVHLRNLENHLRQVCRNIERRCRLASRHRNQLRKVSSLVEDVEAVSFLISSEYLPDSVATRLVSQQREKISAISQINLIGESAIQQDQLNSLQNKLDSIGKETENKLAAMSIDEQRIYRNIFLAVTETAPSLSKAKETIETIMKFNQGGEAESP